MKIKIANLGVIEEAEINLKPLTVFIGHNNTGKTWTAYTLGGILGPDGCNNFSRAYIKGETQRQYPLLEAAINHFVEQGNAQINLIEFAEKYAEQYINDVAALTPKWLRKYLGTGRARFDRLEVNIRLADTKRKLVDQLLDLQSEESLSISTSNSLNLLKEHKNEIIYFYTRFKAGLEKLPERIIREFVVDVIFTAIHTSLYSDIYPFPTERNFLTAYAELVEKDNRLESYQQDTSKVTKDTYSVPIRRFINMIADSASRDASRQAEIIDDDSEANPYPKLSKILEEILRGKFSFEKIGTRRELLFQVPETTLKLEMPITSSMIKELSSLVLYLRYVAKQNNLIIIDEPEMNLHPAAQVEMIEFLAMLVNAGINVLITTHSPYIVDHLVNLMEAAERKDQESFRERFYLESTEAFISKENVSVFLFKDGNAKNVLKEEGYIDWHTFGRVSDDISRMLP